MANNLYNTFGNDNPYANLVKQAQELKKSLPNPQAEVQRLLNTGQMSQAQFNSLAQMAKQVLPYFK